ncbi:unnamed protein product [Schistocephalus solidus]|uniref:DUF1985 domain-containing protein n=1 Tax=Schistocephalus solidus TaxID=70667 RepID=A0A183TDS9_SCHSO|nr:unnamed protein product [Schistocephalus solidus]
MLPALISTPFTGFGNRQLRGDLIQTYRIIRGRDCALEFSDLFELAETEYLWGHPFKLQKKLFHMDVGRKAFSQRELRVDLIHAFRMLWGQDCCLASDDFFKLATTTTLIGHPIKLRVTGVRVDARRFLFSNRVIKAWNALPADIIMAPSVATLKRNFDQYSHKYHRDIRN